MDNYDSLGAAFTRLGFDPTGVAGGNGGLSWGDPTGVRTQQMDLVSGDPTGVRGMQYGFGGWDPVLDWGVHALDAQLDPFPTMGASPTATGAWSDPGGDWGGVSQWTQQINAAAAKYGIPAGMIASVMKVESNGDPNSAGAPGVWGPMQINSNAWGYGPWMEDPSANIDKGAEILKHYLDAANGDWDRALQLYHGIGFDGYTNERQYSQSVMALYSQSGSSAWSGQATSGGLTSMFGSYGNGVADWGEFGVESGLGYYDYGRQYGMNGTQHTGLDVPEPYGTSYAAPMSGTVLCSGTGVGTDSNGGSCAAFEDTIGGGAGRVEVMLDNGVVVIYGHSSKAALQPGSRFQAGQVLGWSGGENSPHVHLETRVRDGSTPSGWRIVDPRSVLGGGGGYYSGAASPSYSATPQNAMMNFLTVPGYHW